MGRNPDPSGWGQVEGPEQGWPMPPLPQRPPGKPKPRLSHKTWLIIASVVVGLGIIGSLLPDPPDRTGTAFPTTTPAPLNAAPSTPSAKPSTPLAVPDEADVTPTLSILTPTPTDTPTPEVPLNASQAAEDWWSEQGGDRIVSTISQLDRYVAAAQAGNFSSAQVSCVLLQDHASISSSRSLLTLPDLNPVVGTDLVQAFEDGRAGTQVAADRCSDFFEKDDQAALVQSIEFAAAGSSELDRLLTGLSRLQGFRKAKKFPQADAPAHIETPAQVQPVECFGARFRYEKVAGLSCDEAIAVLDRVEKTGTTNGARNLETSDYLCFYASFVESQEGQADVICRNKVSEGVSFEAWKM